MIASFSWGFITANEPGSTLSLLKWWSIFNIKSEKNNKSETRSIGFFTPDVCAVRRLQTSCDPIGENAFAYFSPGVALVGGMVGKSGYA